MLQKRKRLQGSLHFLGAAQPSNHTVFVDDEELAQAFDPAAYFDTPAELLGRTYNRPRIAQLANPALIPGGDLEAAKSVSRCAPIIVQELAL